MDKFKEIRPIALGLAIKNNKLLVSEGFDKVKNEIFYRCLGGGIEFLEKGKEALKREFLEEIKDREYYMFPDEAKERGIIDKIIGIDCDLDEII